MKYRFLFCQSIKSKSVLICPFAHLHICTFQYVKPLALHTEHLIFFIQIFVLDHNFSRLGIFEFF